MSNKMVEGNHTFYANSFDPPAWGHYVAAGIIGRTAYALNGLQSLPADDLNLFYTGVIHWLAGNENDALTHLTKCCNNRHAQNLINLITKPKIEILTQLDRGDLCAAVKHDPKFSLRNIGFNPGDLPNHPHASIHEYYDPTSPPDFYITKMLEWHLIPPDIQELPCPIFGQTSDYDLHIQALYPWLPLFDELIVNGSREQQEVASLSGKTVSACPKTFSVLDTLPSIPASKDREIDFFLSGTTFHPFHPDKAAIINHILEIPDLNAVIFNGFLTPINYYDLLSKAKISLSFVRHADAMPTRGLETLAMGCVLLVQKESVLNLYLDETMGVVTYDDKAPESIKEAIGKIISRWDFYGAAARRGAEFVRTEFSAARVASQYLRFLTVLAAKPRPVRNRLVPALLEQKRAVLVKGWKLPQEANQALQNVNLQKWAMRIEKTRDMGALLELTRELVLEHASWANASVSKQNSLSVPLGDTKRFAQIFCLLQKGVAAFPNSIVFRFNAARAVLHFGTPQQVAWGLDQLREIVMPHKDAWEISLLDDIFPWDFFSQTFNYRAYFDAVTTQLANKSINTELLVRLIQGSCHFYLSHFENELEHLKQAIDLDPSFPFYGLAYAKKTIDNNQIEFMDHSVNILIKLAESSMLFSEAIKELLELHQRRPFLNNDQLSFLTMKAHNQRMNIITQRFEIENWQDPALAKTANQLKSGPAKTSSLVSHGNQLNILIIASEPTTFSRMNRSPILDCHELARVLSSFGHTVTLVPAFKNIPTDSPVSWLSHLPQLFADKAYDQIWIDFDALVLEDSFLEQLMELAPIRIAILGESLSHEDFQYLANQQLLQRTLKIERQLKTMTHALTVNKADMTSLQEQGIVNALWVPGTVPLHHSNSRPIAESHQPIVSAGPFTIQEQLWLAQPHISGLVVPHPLPAAGSILSQLYDAANRQAMLALSLERQIGQELLSAHVEALASLHQSYTEIRTELLRGAKGSLIVPLSGVSLGRDVFAGMAAGHTVFCPVYGGTAPEENLFVPGEEIIYFPADDPDRLAALLRAYGRDPQQLQEIGKRAQRKANSLHTLEHRVNQILHWVETGQSALYSGTIPPLPAINVTAQPNPRGICSGPINQLFVAASGKEAPDWHWLSINTHDANEVFLWQKKFKSIAQEALHMGEIHEARKILEWLADNDADAGIHLSELYQIDGDANSALSYALSAYSLRPDYPRALLNAHKMSCSHGTQKSALYFLDEALQRNPPGDLATLVKKRKHLLAGMEGAF